MGQQYPYRGVAGDRKQDSVLVKRFCSFDFKVYPPIRIGSGRLASKVKHELNRIYQLLENEKQTKRFANYKIRKASPKY